MDLRLSARPVRHTMVRIRQAVCFRMSCFSTIKENRMTWEKPQAVDMRWGFEITMYIATR